MSKCLTRRSALKSLAALSGGALLLGQTGRDVFGGRKNPRWEKAIKRGLDWIMRNQSPIRGNWAASNYPTAMAALAGTALICSGSGDAPQPFLGLMQIVGISRLAATSGMSVCFNTPAKKASAGQV